MDQQRYCNIELPNEIWFHIFTFLPPKARLVTAAVCQKWMQRLRYLFGHVNELKIQLTDDSHDLVLSADCRGLKSFAISISMCQCDGTHHLKQNLECLKSILVASNASLHHFVIDDLLTGTSITGETLVALLASENDKNKAERTLRWLELDDIDLQKLELEKFIPLINKRGDLGQLALHKCIASPSLDQPIMDSFYYNFIDHSLTELHVTASPHVSDKLLWRVSRECPVIWLINVRNCDCVTALAVAAFCVTINSRRADLTHLQISGTAITTSTINRYLHDSTSPLAHMGPWKCTPLSKAPHQMALLSEAQSFRPGAATAAGAVFIQTGMTPHKTIMLTA